MCFPIVFLGLVVSHKKKTRMRLKLIKHSTRAGAVASNWVVSFLISKVFLAITCCGVANWPKLSFRADLIKHLLNHHPINYIKPLNKIYNPWDQYLKIKSQIKVVGYKYMCLFVWVLSHITTDHLSMVIQTLLAQVWCRWFCSLKLGRPKTGWNVLIKKWMGLEWNHLFMYEMC